ncbi:Ady4p SCDLUD_001899 [Saccharomycodes ludwigii]|uniref:Ady4p n=1 Tax=Saccharomycodes ludwigii TaxID=36035 RepID=UPI001E875585|nr:hypothetical protein SCDLUD_001899 [Saccharomycodes ludwigii]KAH3902086.1 hypothetical protein SCDLUD_001899 [Saccharomycodes ludwigii]
MATHTSSSAASFSYAILTQLFEENIKPFASIFEQPVTKNSTKSALNNESHPIWSNLFNSVMLMIPKSNYEKILGVKRNQKLIMTSMKHVLYNYPELDLTLEPSFLVRSLMKKKIYEKKSLNKKLKMILQFKVIETFILYYNLDYIQAFQGFKWVIQFLNIVRKYSSAGGIKESLKYERISTLYIAEIISFDFMFNKSSSLKKFKDSKGMYYNRADLVENVLYHIMECTDPNIDPVVCNALDIFMLSKFFEILGDTFETMAMLNSTIVDLENSSSNPKLNENSKTSDVIMFGLLPTRKFMEYMIRNFILASNFKLKGDITLIRCFDKILIGLIFYGQVHLKFIYIFFKLREHFFKKLKTDSTKNVSLTNLYTSTERYCLQLLQKLIAVWDSCKNNVNDEKDVQCPQVIVDTHDKEVIMVEEDESEEERQEKALKKIEAGNNQLNETNSKVNNTPVPYNKQEFRIFLHLCKLKVKQKIHLNNNDMDSSKLWCIGKEWVKLWIDGYIESNGLLTEELKQIVYD